MADDGPSRAIVPGDAAGVLGDARFSPATGAFVVASVRTAGSAGRTASDAAARGSDAGDALASTAGAGGFARGELGGGATAAAESGRAPDAASVVGDSVRPFGEVEALGELVARGCRALWGLD